MAQRVVKRMGCSFAEHMGYRPLGRSDFLAARIDSLLARRDWLGHIRLRHSRRVAVKNHQSAPGG